MAVPRVLGVSAYYHDSAAALVVDGRIVAAAQEERFTRRKHDARFPAKAIGYCLEAGGIRLEEVDFVAFYDKPFPKFERLLETYLAFAPKGFLSFCAAMPVWLREKLFLKDLLCQELRRLSPDFAQDRLLFSEHHMSHAASAFFPSPFERAAVLTMDGVGEWATTSVAYGQGKTLTIDREINFPHSLGLLYSAFTYYTGFKVNSGEYKLMGLAPYGEPRFTKLILDHLIDLKEDGSFRLNLDYFDYCTGLRMTNSKFDALFGAPARKPEQELAQVHMDVAASIQRVTEEVILRITRSVARESGMRKLCMAGGVALNCVANGKVLRSREFDELWIQPAAGDAGGALGAALLAYYGILDGSRIADPDRDAMSGSFLGPSYEQKEIEARLNSAGAHFEVVGDDPLYRQCAESLASGQALGWFQGRMEFGPRALGGRSILADPRSGTMQKTLNLKVKYRESFRPFAPSILREHASDWFELDADSPYMLLVADVAAKRRLAINEDERRLFGIDKLNVPRSEIPAVTHVDYSARVQTVNRAVNSRYHKLLTAFESLTGCPILVNTSFNVRGEPIVCTPEDAFRCFMGTEIEVLAVGNCLLRKDRQNPDLRASYTQQFDPD